MNETIRYDDEYWQEMAPLFDTISLPEILICTLDALGLVLDKNPKRSDL